MPPLGRPRRRTPISPAASERKSAAFQALASLPSAAEVGTAYSTIGARIDAIAAKAERRTSLAIALMGLKELRATVTAQAQLAGHIGSGAQVQVNTQVNLDLGAAVRELIAAIRARPDTSIPPELAVHLEGAPPLRKPSSAWRRSSMPISEAARQIARQALYTLSPSAWCRRELHLTLDGWQVRMVDAPAASRVIALTHRQAGKTTAAAVGVAHTMVWRQPGSTSLVLAPTLRQSSELIRNLRGRLFAAGERLTVDNVFAIELANGSRALALPGFR